MKKILALVMALVLAVSVCAAFAEESAPSKTVEDMVAVEILSENNEDFELAAATVISDEFAAELEKLAACEDLAAYLGIDADELVCMEIVELGAANAAADTDVKVKFVFATPFAQDAKVCLAIGFNAEEGVEYTIVPAEVTEDGALVVELPYEIVARMMQQPALVLVLTAPIA